MHATELFRGTLQTILLKLLADHGRMYGYEITQTVKELSDNSMVLTEGSLYPALHRLEAEGLVKTETVLIGKRVRKYYSLTRDGKKETPLRVSEFEAFMFTMRNVLNLKTAV